ncbi:MAG TPA: M20/M25/M40 family metallo-hydrolase [Chitinophagales bacterium]|nr:M20/M25/M40 family metallo-hydrolase [Chitinophagales bacterium]HRP40225.1 M20/M25/M40 family metallo-hydrolase [Chitinophagales bacterium]
MNNYLASLLVLLFVTSQSYSQENSSFKNLRQLTFGGDNAEAYFSPNGKMLTMQVSNPKAGIMCDQIFKLNIPENNTVKNNLQLVSTGLGRTTCSFFMPDNKHVLYASTHETNKDCPPQPESKGKYLWPLYPEFDIYMADLNGKIVRKIVESPGYDAEAVVSPDGKKIAFTSVRSGDLEIWIMDIDGFNLKQITHGLGYDGGAFFSHDSKKLVFRSSRPTEPNDIKEYKENLANNLVAPTNMEIYTVNIDGSNLKQITKLGKANWAPYFYPKDNRIIFSSNHHSQRGYDFQLFSIDTNGNDLKQITFESNFNSFPMFSPDGKKIAFSSNRIKDKPKETNVYIADWIEPDPAEIVSDNQLKKHISYLASDELEGRLTGSNGEKKAANYIAAEFKRYGLKPYSGNSFFQNFKYNVRINPHDTTNTKPSQGKNVIAYLNNNADRTIIIGAHYDHLGKNEHHHSTKTNSEGEIHNGADDNASGTAGLLELARIFSQNKIQEKANYIFAAFSGEEDGLIGSKYMAETVKEKYPNITAMINMDMIGRLNDHKELTVGGTGTCPNFSNIIQTNKPAGFTITEDSAGIGPSDHTSFYLKDIPVLFFFSGVHTDYHKPSDDENKINYYGTRFIVDYVYRTANMLAQKEQLTFTKTKIKASKKAAAYKVTLGIMPSYADNNLGLLVDGIVDGKPADKAGMKAGDIIVKIGDCEIKEVYSYMECLSKINPGEQKEITVVRDKNEIKLHVIF